MFQDFKNKSQKIYLFNFQAELVCRAEPYPTYADHLLCYPVRSFVILENLEFLNQSLLPGNEIQSVNLSMDFQMRICSPQLSRYAELVWIEQGQPIRTYTD